MVADRDAFDGSGPERDDFADDEPFAVFIRCAIEAKTKAADTIRTVIRLSNDSCCAR